MTRKFLTEDISLDIHSGRRDRGVSRRLEIGAGASVWYRVVGSRRRTKREMLRSGGGRFHDDPEREPTTYLADSLETAWLEVKAHAGEARLDLRAFRAWRIALTGRVARRLVDLGARDEQERYHVDQAELGADPAPESGKALARRLRKEGKAGIIYRSVRNRPNGVCVALFLEGAEAELSVEAAREEWERFIRAAQPPGKGKRREG